MINDFRPNGETKIIIHGWQSNSQTDTVQRIKDAYLLTRDCNVIGKYNLVYTPQCGANKSLIMSRSC